ncbi:MAG: hypothetical protein GTO45_33905 [Candidatus Aminicenantes bacterium]|nr:hypothetical protein [Candidatus Aminicenantes bacterium]NIM83704.1 hypothetical protein [Candidatus Aminicenantes bacterium]NIN23129.1 hypothetical protein [Candidatus Aminicenantes bacterium]NIN46856.1 hypothetical protein [Candidatus Aminicenantes bacterium]NIN89778.1 hypothetical protein [Candidatus Aminicenantes bacterium]
MSKNPKKEPEMIKDSSVTKEMADLKAEIAELKQTIASHDERIRKLEEKLG